MIRIFCYFYALFTVLSTTTNSVNEGIDNSLMNNDMYDIKEKIILAKIVKKKGFTEKEKDEILRLHNLYRRNVTPPAGDMIKMEWSDCLIKESQTSADRCKFEHAKVNEIVCDGSTGVGENLYKGHERTGKQAVKLWYGEHVHYDFKSLKCKPTEMCGHYTQVVWSSSRYVGCGISSCESKYYIIACHYSPAGNMVEQHPYAVGKPCSLCKPISDGGFCHKGLCVSSAKHRTQHQINITCPLKCHNCGMLDKEKCLCNCAPGWDALDCSVKCENKDKNCLKNPGYPSKASCTTNNNKVQDLYCRKMCDQCRGIGENKGLLNIEKLLAMNEICCDGKMCPKGHVLDLKNCNCNLLCPGPVCSLDNDKDHGEEVKAGKIAIIFANILLFYQYILF